MSRRPIGTRRLPSAAPEPMPRHLRHHDPADWLDARAPLTVDALHRARADWRRARARWLNQQYGVSADDRATS